MKIGNQFVLAVASALTTVAALAAAEKDEVKPVVAPSTLFADETLCKGKGVDVRRSQLDESMLQFKANLNARREVLSEDKRELVESQILDRLVITQLLLNRATEEDRLKAKELAQKFIKDTREQAGSDDAFDRQLLAMGFTQRQFEDQIMDRAISEAVVERELRDKINITDDQVKKYYDENGSQFERPEMARAAHILQATRDPLTGNDLTEDQKKQKKEQIEKLLERIRKGEDFAALAKEYSEDPGSKEKGGEYTFARGRGLPPAFEAVVFSLKTNEVSEVVITPSGYHIIKLYEKTPAQKMAYAEAAKPLKERLAQQEVQKGFPNYTEKLKKEASLQYLNGAKPPPEPAAGQLDGKPESKPDAKQ